MDHLPLAHAAQAVEPAAARATRAGGTAVNLPGGEIYTSMQTGVIDALSGLRPTMTLPLAFKTSLNIITTLAGKSQGRVLN